MKKHFTYSLLAILLLTLLVYPSSAWFYNDFPEPGKAADTKFEMFGPRVDRLLIKLYSTAEAEWEALKKSPQELDLTDWPLAKAYYDQFIVPPYDAKVNVESVGGEFGIRNLDMNQNDNPFLGAPQDPLYVNPKHNLADADPKNNHNPTSDVNMRKAILSCIDRAYYVATFIGSGFAVEHWSMLPPATGLQYYQETFKMYPFSPTAAAGFLDAAVHKFKINAATGFRYWDLNDNNVEDADEWVELDFVIRSDDPIRNNIGIHLSNTLEAAPVKVRILRSFRDITGARAKWMGPKNAHMYTAGWSLGIEPDSIVLWMGDAGVGAALSYYWHPGTCYNTAYANDATFNINARIVEIANSEAEAIAAMAICNQRAAEMALNGPMFVFSSTMANARKYVGGTPAEEDYVGRYWKGMVMVTGYGSDSFFGMLNMHPEGYPLPADGVIRYGFKTTDIRSFNSLYADVLWDNKILNLVYDSLVYSNPYALTQRLPWLCKQYAVGTYEHPVLGPCTKVWITLRNDVQWSDGTPLTTADVYFTLVELDDLLVARGLPKQWWYSAVKSILSFEILDPMNFEILINVKSIWAIGLTGLGVRLMPEHIWRPIITSGTPAQIQGAHPDVNMITSGAWRFREYVSTAYVDLVANKPGRTVKTKFAVGDEGVPITSPKGFFRYYPKYVDIHADNYRAIIFLASWSDSSVDVHLTVTDHNLLQEQFDFLWPAGPHPGSPVGEHIIFEPIGCDWQILTWIDGNPPEYPPDGMLSVCDMIQIQGIVPATPPIWVHVQSFPAPNVIHVGQVIEAIKNVYVDINGDGDYLDAGEHLAVDVHEFEKPCHPIIEEFTVNLARGYHVATVTKEITTEWMLQQDNTVVPFPWRTTITTEWPIWITYIGDIVGSYYINPKLTAPNFQIDLGDIFHCAKALDSYPGHPRWSPYADLNGDYIINMIDFNMIARNFTGRQEIAITDISVSKNVVCKGYSVNVNVTLRNEGTSPQNVSSWVRFGSNVVHTETVYISNGASAIKEFYVVPRAFLFEEISREHGPIGSVTEQTVLNETGTGTYVTAKTGLIDMGSKSVLGGIIDLRYKNHTQITHEELIIYPNPVVFTDIDYADGMYAIGTINGGLCFLDDKGEYGELSLGPTPVTNVTVNGPFVNVALQGEAVVLERYLMDFTLPKGNYTISAYAEPVLGETNTADNIRTDGWVVVSMVGDLTGGTANPWDFIPDAKVDGKDQSVVLKCFGSWPGAPPPMIWNPNCDITNDKQIDGRDGSIGARHYGEADP